MEGEADEHQELRETMLKRKSKKKEEEKAKAKAKAEEEEEEVVGEGEEKEEGKKKKAVEYSNVAMNFTGPRHFLSSRN